MWDAERAAAGVMLNEAFPGAARMRIATKLKAAANHQVAFCASPATFVFSAPSSLSRIRGVTIVQGPLVTPPSPFLTLCHRRPLPWRPTSTFALLRYGCSLLLRRGCHCFVGCGRHCGTGAGVSGVDTTVPARMLLVLHGAASQQP